MKTAWDKAQDKLPPRKRGMRPAGDPPSVAPATDYTVQNHGSIFLVRPTNDAAQEWLADNTDGTWFGGALAVEPRYVRDLVEGLQNDGFSVE